MDARRPKQMLLRLITVAVLAPWVTACSSDSGSFNILPKLGTFDSLSVSSAPVNAELRPVTAADLVGAQGECAASGPGAAAPRGGIALEMTECEVIGRAGTPANIELGTNDRGERMVTLTYTGEPIGPASIALPRRTPLCDRARPGAAARACQAEKAPAQEAQIGLNAPGLNGVLDQLIADSKAALASSQSSSARASALTASARPLASAAARAGSPGEQASGSASRGVDGRDLLAVDRLTARSRLAQ